MTDARTLLRAKRQQKEQETRISHPLAAYTPAGQLRCVACGCVVRGAGVGAGGGAGKWEGHVGSKAHRGAVLRMREREREERERERERGKRKAVGEEEEEQVEEGEEGKKRRRVEVRPPPSTPPAPPPSTTTKGFPADFFSDPSTAPAPPSDDEEEADVDAAPQTQTSRVIDEEWAQFQQMVLNPPSSSTAGATSAHEAYERATIVAEPVLATETPAGFPAARGEDAEGGPIAGEGGMSEEEVRKRREAEERELIMDRLVEEEQAQEEADARVALLKKRLEGVRRARQLARERKAGA